MTRRQWGELILVLAVPFIIGMGISAFTENLEWANFAVPCLYMILAMQVIGEMNRSEEKGGEEESTPPMPPTS